MRAVVWFDARVRRCASHSPHPVRAALQALRRKQVAVTVASTREQDHAAAFGGVAPVRGPEAERDSGDALLDWGFKSISTLIQRSYTTGELSSRPCERALLQAHPRHLAGRLNLSSRELAHLPRALYPSLEYESFDEQTVARGVLDLSIAPASTHSAATPWYAREPLRSLNAANNLLEEIEPEIEELGELGSIDVRAPDSLRASRS